MKLQDFFAEDKAVELKQFFKGEKGIVAAIHLRKGEALKKHMSPVEARLVCISGSMHYTSDAGDDILLGPADYQNIPAGLYHEVYAREESMALLLR